MENIHTRPLSAIEGSLWGRQIPQVAVLIYLLAALAVFLTIPFLAWNWIRLPFIGVFLQHNLVISNVNLSSHNGVVQSINQLIYGSGQGSGRENIYRLQAIEGDEVRTERDLRAALIHFRPGDQVILQVGSSRNRTTEVVVTLSQLSIADQFGYFYLPYFIGIIYLGVGIWIFLMRRGQKYGQIFAQNCVWMALSIGLFFDNLTTHLLTPLWTLSVVLAGGSLVSLVMLNPREDRLIRRKPWVVHIASVIAFLLAGFTLIRLFDEKRPYDYRFLWFLEFAFVGMCLLFAFVWMSLRYHKLDRPDDRELIRWTALSLLVSFAPVVSWMVSPFFGVSWQFQPFLLVPMVIFPVITGISIHRYPIVRSDALLSIGIQYGVMTLIIAVGYAMIASGLGLLLYQMFPTVNSLVIGAIFFLLALAINPLRVWTQNLVDSVFFRGRRAYQGRLQTFSGDLTSLVDLQDILKVFRRYIEETLAPVPLHIFIYDPLSELFIAAPDSVGRSTSDLRFPLISGLVIRLGNQHAPFLLNEYDNLPVTMEHDRTRLALLGAQVFIPLPGRQRLSGWLALGSRKSGEPFSSVQLDFLEALCDQAALAIERAQVVANMEKRVREMNLLTRVAQGINITLALDDIFELVYAQTTQIIPASSLHIMLYQPDVDNYRFVFYLEGEDRVLEKENRPVPAGHTLEQEVIRQRRPILTESYAVECKRRGVLKGEETAEAWIGVPLNAGAETIGALSLGNADPSVEYTLEQRSLLQAIADQVAGALVKTRLLEETERRARQLASLNEVTRQLTSTLETEPLLQSILESAVEILNCEAGSLLMVDEQADELVFKVTVGPVASNLVNHRMSIDQGLVGKAVRTGEPIIVNDVTSFPEWFSKNDQQTGFVTQALLAMPLQIKDRVFGAIEVINKKDGTFFTQDDLDLVSAFASQAVVAIENARLYTLTDLALASRVEELSVMQRIDRELNTSLDTTTAMTITLEWAMRQSAANAGLVSVTQPGDPSGVTVVASQGYTHELEPYQMGRLPIEHLNLQDAILSGLPIRRSLDGNDNLIGLLEGAGSQVVLPIRRETNTIGLLLLESISEEPVTDEILGFLSRLTDHASIAISNAQLYTAVQQANLAKSDFVSFVAHELKNPMTSVKGYTELISAGAVGPVTDIQANFLSTIRHNIERMNTLVSDLNDMSKIEVGRLRLDFKATQVHDIVDSVMRSTRKQIEEKQQQLILDIPAGLAPVWADRMRIEQVIVNLVSNAHKYTPAGGSIKVCAEQVPNQWDSSGAANVVHIWVSDNGIGIGEEDQKKIFQKFFRSEDPKTREVTGTGLGLNITRSLVEMQGGRIWFESEFRQGTTFHFTIPVSEN